MDNNFKIIMPAEIIKGEDGEYKIGGLASTESTDKQGESLIQKGIDLTPVAEGRGFFNFDHSNKPEDIIGTIDGYKHDNKGLYVHGKLFKGHQRAESIYHIMKGLSDRKKGAIGLSVEGKVLERDPVNPRIIKKCQIKNVAVTFNPVNQDTYASLVKSLSASEISFDATEANLQEKDSDISCKETPFFTANQVIQLLEKALTAGEGYTKAPIERSGGEALSTESLDSKKKKLKKMSKEMYKSSIGQVLDNIQKLYPDYSRNVLWEALKERLNKKFPEIQDF